LSESDYPCFLFIFRRSRLDTTRVPHPLLSTGNNRYETRVRLGFIALAVHGSPPVYGKKMRVLLVACDLIVSKSEGTLKVNLKVKL
jgi:hypothetical protein